jgi:hypothetical protein
MAEAISGVPETFPVLSLRLGRFAAGHCHGTVEALVQLSHSAG